MPAGAFDIVSSLARFIPPVTIIDKPGSFLTEKERSTLIVSGSETDVCVLATVRDAVDRSYRLIVVEEGFCSSSDQGRNASLHRSVELLRLDEVIELWREAP